MRPSSAYRYLLSRPDPYGIGVLSRWPLESVTPVDLAGDGLPSLTGIAIIEGRPLRFPGLHTHWPMVPALARARDVSLARTADLVCEEELPVVVLGDLNLTPHAPAFARLLRQSGVRDALAGPRWQPTWQAAFWPLALRIDHVLVGPGLCVAHAEVGSSIGSDHRPVVAQLRVAEGPEGPNAGAVTRDHRAHLLEQPRGHHRVEARVDALVEQRPRRAEPPRACGSASKSSAFASSPIAA